jgi:anti-anti-sigma factor
MTAVDVVTRGPGLATPEADLAVQRRVGVTIAELHGDLDIVTVPALRERLLGLLCAGARLLIIELSGISFCDVAGLAMLIGTQHRAAARGVTVHLAAPRPQMTKLLRVTGLDRSLTICATLSDALPAEAA